jgi:mannosyltransferase OCH1-like enzyme
MSLIPRKIYQSWKTKDLSENMAKNCQKLRELNPDYDYELSDDNDCRQFLQTNFGLNYANAFDVLIPGAFKCDFWRYAKLYVEGGVYLDIDIIAEIPLNRIIQNGDEFISVVDRSVLGHTGVYQAFIACRPKHPILLIALELAFSNIATRRTEVNPLCITGPCMMATALNLFWQKSNTNEKIRPGLYPNGVKLLKLKDGASYTCNLDGQVIFTNKMDGYSVDNYYGITNKFFKNGTDSVNPLVYYIKLVFFIIIVGITGWALTYTFRKKWKNCQKSCSR